MNGEPAHLNSSRPAHMFPRSLRRNFKFQDDWSPEKFDCLKLEKWWGQWVFNVDNFSEFRVPAPITGLCLIIADVM